MNLGAQLAARLGRLSALQIQCPSIGGIGCADCRRAVGVWPRVIFVVIGRFGVRHRLCQRCGQERWMEQLREQYRPDWREKLPYPE